MNKDTESPLASINIDDCPALNKVMWTASGEAIENDLHHFIDASMSDYSGQQLIIGDYGGKA